VIHVADQGKPESIEPALDKIRERLMSGDVPDPELKSLQLQMSTLDQWARLTGLQRFADGGQMHDHDHMDDHDHVPVMLSSLIDVQPADPTLGAKSES
jgi:hypothetical protein